MTADKSYSEWHTLTIEPDYEDEDGKAVLATILDHPVGCRPPADPDTDWYMYRCWTDDLVGEFAEFPDLIGLPTAPGTYRVRAWGTSGDWAGSHYIEPDCGVEFEQLDPPTA